MTSPRRGFSRERHTTLKAAISAVAVAGFALAWAGFGRSHEVVVDSAPPATATEAPSVPTPGSTPVPSSTPTAAATASKDSEGEPLPPPSRAKRSRGS